jgi:hypothetical protein
MAKHSSPIYARKNDRRSGFNRRWIKSRYSGEDRRSGKDRREGLPGPRDLAVPGKTEANKMVGIEKLLVSNTIQLEAVTRILLEKGIIGDQELLEMIKNVQSEYQDNFAKENSDER